MIYAIVCGVSIIVGVLLCLGYILLKINSPI